MQHLKWILSNLIFAVILIIFWVCYGKDLFPGSNYIYWWKNFDRFPYIGLVVGAGAFKSALFQDPFPTIWSIGMILA